MERKESLDELAKEGEQYSQSIEKLYSAKRQSERETLSERDGERGTERDGVKEAE